ncbi:unnamed protein product [Phaedon cochleariae]|uniref:Major facilitator superfamily (MFS) profile domain-containing protein n=1 Tax=Phaedon cochleariae TaxID=80249 RepID=A0A9P0DA89_PHACE|nr:unnamed protein product [Phaedon cochleariae]
MEPLSASCLNLAIQEDAANEKILNDKLTEMIVSSKSLSRYEGKSFKTILPQVIATFISAGYHIVVGMALSYSAILIPALNGNITEDGNDEELYATKTECSWIASVVVLVVPLGAVTIGMVMDNIGRLNAVKLAIIPTILGWGLIAAAQNVTMIIVGRIIVGLATAWGSIPATVYITEIARPDVRGTLVSAAPSLSSIGMVVCFLMGWFLHWRTVAWVAILYASVPIMLLFCIPESPAWLVSRGKIQQAADSLRWFNKYQPQPENRGESLAELQLSLLQREHQTKLEEQAWKGEFGAKAKMMEFLKPTGYKPLLVLFGLFFFQQFSGIYITLFYSVTFFQAVGSDFNPYLASTFIAVIRVIMSCINTYMLKYFRRRPLVIVSGFGMAICMLLSGLFTHLVKEGSFTHTWVPVFFLLLYVVTSMIGLLPIPWTMTAELFPIEIRGAANSATYSLAYVTMSVSIQSFWTLESWFQGIAGLQWFFAAVCILSSVYTYVFLPETHGKKLSDITEYFVHNTIFLGSTKQEQSTGTVGRKDIHLTNGQSQKLIKKSLSC